MPVDKDFNQVESSSVKTGGPTETAITTTIVNSLVDGEPLADDGETYSDIQTAENNASSWIFVPPGTFDENVTVDTSNLMLVGVGKSSSISPSSGVSVDIQTTNITLKSLNIVSADNNAVSNDGSSGNALISHSFIDGDSNAIDVPGGDTIVTSCSLQSTNNDGINGLGPRSITSNNLIDGNDSGTRGWELGSNNNIVSHCIITNYTDAGIRAGSASSDNLFVSNRIDDAGNHGVEVNNGSNNIIANNRVTNTTNTTTDSGTNTIFDGNK